MKFITIFSTDSTHSFILSGFPIPLLNILYFLIGKFRFSNNCYVAFLATPYCFCHFTKYKRRVYFLLLHKLQIIGPQSLSSVLSVFLHLSVVVYPMLAHWKTMEFVLLIDSDSVISSIISQFYCLLVSFYSRLIP